jgi:hypothetical protein
MSPFGFVSAGMAMARKTGSPSGLEADLGVCIESDMALSLRRWSRFSPQP